MKPPPKRSTPVLIAVAVLALVYFFQALPLLSPRLDFFQRLEWMTYDWRVRQAFVPTAQVATNLGAVFIDDVSIGILNQLRQVSYPWPRQYYGQLVEELTTQGAKTIAFDVFFIDAQKDYAETRVQISKDTNHPVYISSDQYFARRLHQAGNVILAAPGRTNTIVITAPGKTNIIGTREQWNAILPIDLLRTNALAVGHADSDRDSDGVLRRVAAYKPDPQRGRIWQLGIVLAAQALGLDLEHPVIRPGKIILHGPKGVERRIPVGQDGLFYIDWSLKVEDSRIHTDSAVKVIGEQELRGSTYRIEPAWRNKIVVVGSIGTGNNITDAGATPLAHRSFLVSAHWNIANSVMMGRFVRKSGYLTEMLLILLMSAIATYLSWRFRALAGTFSILAVAGLYTAVAVWLYVKYLYWLPVVLPVAGTLMITYSGMVCYRVIIERYVRASFAGTFSPEVVKLLSEGTTAPLVAPLLGLPPNVITSLLAKDTLTVGGSRRRLTIYFADLRGFTELTETRRSRTEAYLQEHPLSDEASEEMIDQEARELLATVNLYLGTIVEAITEHDGTLDKYIGDCVMAFWGAPAPNPQHALACVRGAIASQRAVLALNEARDRQNRQLERENSDRAKTGLPPLPSLPILRMGSGVSTGTLTVGFMGSPAHVSNYTVFGREVAIASRLEGISGHGRIIVSESTYAELRRDDPQLAASCRELPPVTVKGIRTPLQIYEVPWQPPGGQAPVGP